LDVDWDPYNDDWFPEPPLNDPDSPHMFHDNGEYKCYHLSEFSSVPGTPRYVCTNVVIYTDPVDYQKFQPNFGRCSVDIIKKTFEHTTQHVRSLHLYGEMRRHFKSRFPAFNVARNEPVATDTIFLCPDFCCPLLPCYRRVWYENRLRISG
jgi:hypothetical protein